MLIGENTFKQVSDTHIQESPLSNSLKNMLKILQRVDCLKVTLIHKGSLA